MNMEVSEIEIRGVRVLISINYELIAGVVYLENKQRLQDLMNDKRAFIPVEIIESGQKRLVLYRKTSIDMIQEV